MSDYPIKICDYCKREGKAYSFLDGNTICPVCFKRFPPSTHGMRMKICELESRVATLRADLERVSESRAVLDNRIRELEGENERLRDALEFYSDPGTYFAIGFFPDRPCGEFIDDFDETYLGLKPGKLARSALAARKEAEDGRS